jgi:predicted DNA-binding transcriptional regulator YafY
MREGHRLEKVQEIDNLLHLQILESIAVGAGKSFARRSKALLGRLKNEEALPIQSYLPIEDVTSHAPLFRMIEEAINDGTALAFDYHGKPRRVHPYRIVNFDGYWYLLGFEPASGLAKKFYLKEIRAARRLEERFTPDKRLLERIDGALNAWFDPNEEPFELHLLAKAPIVKYLRRRPVSRRQHIVARHADGDVELVIRATTEKEALELLKLWIPDLAVLAPASVKKAYENLLKKALGLQTGHDAV